MTENKKADDQSTNTGGVSRRTVTKAMAWAVPAIAVAAPVPAFAGASQGILRLDGTGCKLPGNATDVYKGYAFNLSATNTTANTYYCVRIDSVTLDGDDLGAVTVVNLAAGACANLGNPFCVPPGAVADYSNLALVTAEAGNSSNGQLIVNYSVSLNAGSCLCPGGTFVAAPPATTGINDAPPIVGASCDSFTPLEKACIGALSVGS